MLTLRTLTINALFRPVKQAIWPGYERFLHPDLPLWADGVIIDANDLPHFTPSYYGNTLPSHPDTIIRALEDCVLLTSEHLHHIFPDERYSLAVSGAVPLYNQHLGLLVHLAMTHWVRVWNLSLTKADLSVPYHHNPETALMLDHGRRTGAYTYKSHEKNLYQFGGSKDKDHTLKNELNHLTRCVAEMAATGEMCFLAQLKRHHAEELKGTLSRTVADIVTATLARHKFVRLTPIFRTTFLRFREFVTKYTCRVDPTWPCDCPAATSVRCPTNVHRPEINESCCGALRWQPGVWSNRRRHVPSFDRFSVCEYCLLDAFTSAGKDRHYGIVTVMNMQMRYLTPRVYCETTRMEPFARNRDDLALASICQPLASVLHYYELNKQPTTHHQLQTTETMVDLTAEEEVDNMLVIDSSSDDDATEEEVDFELDQILDTFLSDFNEPCLMDLYAADE